jgi:endonuclease YncB( thermonuclease family)
MQLKVKTWETMGTVVSVDTGDSITVDVEQSPWAERMITVNLSDIRAPDLDGPDGQMSRDALSVMLPKGAHIKVVGYHFEKYGILKATIYHPDMEKSVNNWMVANGFAFPM